MKTEEIISKSERYLIHNYSRYPIAPVRGEGCWLWDADGRRYLDFATGIAVTSLGHSHPAIIHAIQEQAKKLIHASNLYHIEQQTELAEMLVNNSFADKVFFCNSGAEANEGAIKLARRWGAANGGRYKIVSALGSFHGRTLGALSATGHKKYQKGFTPMVSGFKFVAYGSVEAVEKALKDEKVCAVILEPVQGENGVIIPPENYLSSVRDLCRRRNLLLILDEIQVGLGRTGLLFAYQHDGVEPDIMTLAKALGGGIPSGAVLASDEVAVHLSPGSHGSTMGGNPLAMHAGCAVLKTLIGDDGLLDNVTRMGIYFLEGLKDVKRRYGDLIRDVRGIGLILGIEFKNKEKAKQVSAQCMDYGLLTILTQEKVMRILPPLIVRQDEIDFALERINRALGETS